MLEKVVLVTGADGGLGRLVTQAFLEVGATVIGASGGSSSLPSKMLVSSPWPQTFPVAKLLRCWLTKR